MTCLTDDDLDSVDIYTYVLFPCPLEPNYFLLPICQNVLSSVHATN